MPKRFFILPLLTPLLGSVLFTAVLADEIPVCDSTSACQTVIDEYQSKIEQLKKKENSLSNEISFMENQIGLTGAKIFEVKSKITQKEEELAKLSGDIEDLEIRLDRVSRSLSFQRSIFSQRVGASYKNGKISPLELFFSSNSFSDIITRFKYLKVLEVQDQKLIKQMEETRKNFTAQKVIVRDKKDKVEIVKKAIENEKKNLESYKNSLSGQRKEKQLLLTLTQNDEVKYRSLLNKALAEKEALERAILSLELKDGKSVKKGDIIALMGNSGYPNCSTGPHLHLEVRKKGSVLDPADFLIPHDISYEEGVQSMSFKGGWVWPLSDPVIVSQEFGMSFWAKRGFYGGGPHTGIDIYNKSDSTIKAVADGTLYRGSTSCGRSTLKYVAVDHGDDLFSFYFHVQ